MTSPFVTPQNPLANINSLSATVTALVQDMNILIVSNQRPGQAPNLTGANAFSIVAISASLVDLQRQVSTLTSQVTTLKNEVAILQQKTR